MVTGPYFLDLDPFRSSKSKLELVQFHSPYLKSNFVQFQIHSSSKILPKSSKFIPVAEILQAFYLIFPHIKLGNLVGPSKDRFSAGNTEKAPIWILSIANTSLKRYSISDERDFGKEIYKGEVFSFKLELNWFFSWMNRSIPDPLQLSRKGSRSVQDPKKVECNPDLELMRSVPDHVWPWERIFE